MITSFLSLFYSYHCKARKQRKKQGEGVKGKQNRLQWNLNVTKSQGMRKLVDYIEVLLSRKPRYNKFGEKQPKCSLYQGIFN